MRARRRFRGAAPALLCGLLIACVDGEPDEQGAGFSLIETLSGADTAGYARAREPRAFSFPREHHSHPEYRTEWWYVTGNLTSEDGRDFGFQLTVFRSAVAPDAPANASTWATNQAYMAHFTVTDVAAERFHAFERFARGAAGLAGTTGDPVRVWLEDWVLEGDGAGGFPSRLVASQDGVRIELALERGKPVVLQGERGLSRKGPEPGNASYYYSFPRLPAVGRLILDGDTSTVRGLAWLDREWGTSVLGEGVVGWDWFALQLSDGWDLMIFRLRRGDGTADPWSAGSLVRPDGEAVPLDASAAEALTSTGSWASPVDGAVYPSGWRVRVPGRGWDLRVEPRLEAQELDLSFRYWEGAVAVSGTGEGGAPVTGRGYVELTGYAGARPER